MVLEKNNYSITIPPGQLLPSSCCLGNVTCSNVQYYTMEMLRYVLKPYYSFRGSCCIYKCVRFSYIGDRRCRKLVIIRGSHSRYPMSCCMLLSLQVQVCLILKPSPQLSGWAPAVGFRWLTFLWQRARVTKWFPFPYCRCWPWPRLRLLCCCLLLLAKAVDRVANILGCGSPVNFS